MKPSPMEYGGQNKSIPLFNSGVTQSGPVQAGLVAATTTESVVIKNNVR